VNERNAPIAQYLQALERLAFRAVRFGGSTVILFGADELDDGQVGYSRTSDGEARTGTPPSAWSPTWLVIGYEESLGDPFFVDLNEDTLPVFTAIHGDGEWNPSLVAASFDGFIGALDEVRAASANREDPISLTNRPVSEPERARLIATIASHVGCDPAMFCAVWGGFRA
jgi:hypothetical protein